MIKVNQWRYTGASMPDKNHQVIYFDSPYFEKPNALYIEGSMFRALDKDNTTIVIDTDKMQLLKAPNDRVTLSSVDKTNAYTKISFAIQGLVQEDKMMYGLLGDSFTDGAGQIYKMSDARGDGAVSRTSGGSDKQESYAYIPSREYRQPLTFNVSNYPSYIRTPYKILIK